MIEAIILGIIAVAAAGFGYFYRPKPKMSQETVFPYTQKTHFYSNEERKFLGALMQACGHKYLILGKVSIGNLVSVLKSAPAQAKILAYQQISGQHIDFVICDQRSSEILAVVELYDASANEAKMKRCAMINKVLKTAKLPIIRFRKTEHYSVEAVKSVLDATIAGPKPLMKPVRKQFAEKALALQ